MQFEDLLKNLEAKVNLESNKVDKEKQVIEQFLLEIANMKVSIWKPWTYFSFFKKIQKAIPVIGSIAHSSLRDQMDVQQMQIDMIKVQQTFSQDLEELRKRVEK